MGAMMFLLMRAINTRLSVVLTTSAMRNAHQTIFLVLFFLWLSFLLNLLLQMNYIQLLHMVDLTNHLLYNFHHLLL